MSDQHTLGLLRKGKLSDNIVTDSPIPGGFAQDPHWVKHYGGYLVAESVTTANRRRLVACWNACQGIDTEDLETGSVSIIQKLHDASAKNVMAQRNELMEALTEARRWIGDGECSDGLAREYWTPEYRAAVDRIDAAIAKVKGDAA